VFSNAKWYLRCFLPPLSRKAQLHCSSAFIHTSSTVNGHFYSTPPHTALHTTVPSVVRHTEPFSLRCPNWLQYPIVSDHRVYRVHLLAHCLLYHYQRSCKYWFAHHACPIYRTGPLLPSICVRAAVCNKSRRAGHDMASQAVQCHAMLCHTFPPLHHEFDTPSTLTNWQTEHTLCRPSYRYATPLVSYSFTSCFSRVPSSQPRLPDSFVLCTSGRRGCLVGSVFHASSS